MAQSDLGAMVGPLGRRGEAESGTQRLEAGDKGFSSHADNADWQTRGAHTEQMVS